MVEKINTTNDQNAETNVDWLQNGERTNETNLNRPVKQVAEKVNELIDYVDDSNADLQSQIDERVSIDMSLSSSIDAEAAARANADSVLQSNIDSETAARANADSVLQSNIDSETAARANADSVLQSNINNLQSQIDAEETNRFNSDSALQNQINLLSLAENISVVDNFISHPSAGKSNTVQGVLESFDINLMSSLNSLSQDLGYFKIPARYGLQYKPIYVYWGRVRTGDINWTVQSSVKIPTSFAPEFPTNCLAISATYEEASPPNFKNPFTCAVAVRNVTKSGFEIWLDEWEGTTQDGYVRYIAIGY